MSYDHNSFSIQCRLVKDPDYKNLTDKALVQFPVAVSAGKDKADFFDVKAWGTLAEFAQKYLKKGSSVIIGGRITQEKWNDKDGGKRSKVVLVASSISFAGGKKQGDETPQQDSHSSCASRSDGDVHDKNLDAQWGELSDTF